VRKDEPSTKYQKMNNDHCKIKIKQRKLLIEIVKKLTAPGRGY